LKFTRNRYQQGSLRKCDASLELRFWEYQVSQPCGPGSPMRPVTLSCMEYPTETKALPSARGRASNQRFESFRRTTGNAGLVIDRSHRGAPEGSATGPGEAHPITDAFPGAPPPVTQLPQSHIRPNGELYSTDARPLEISEWLSLCLCREDTRHVGALLHLLFERAMLWGLMDVQRNPIGVVKLREPASA